VGCFPDVPRGLRGPALAVLVAALAVIAAGCGQTTSNGPAKVGRAVPVGAPASGCGSFARPAAQDPDGVLAGLSAADRAAYAGLPVRRSAWNDFKVSHKPPYSVGIVWPGLVNPFISDALRNLEADLKATGLIGSIRVSTTGSNVDIPQQLQQMQQEIVRKPDLMIAAPLQP
jgi:ABC-type sugar transport system substrate-binding protein